MNAPMAGTQEWLAQVVEEVVEPDLPIVDSHHHLWPDGGPLPYGLAELHDDTGSGHRIEQSVFIECGAAYHADGPPDLAPVGETEFVAGVARRDPTRLISAIVAHVDLRSSRVEYLLDAHDEAGDGLLRGVRDAIARAEDPEGLMIPGSAPGGLSLDQDFRAGMRALGRRGLTYDSWHYHFQHHEF